MGLLDKILLLEKFQRIGWIVADRDHFFVAPPTSFWDSMKGRQFHVYHADEILRLLDTGQDGSGEGTNDDD